MNPFVCPRCKTELDETSSAELRCSKDGVIFRRVDGIWRFLLPEREQYYARFISDYETVRRLEGRGSTDTSYYRALPFTDLSSKFSADWEIRAVSYRALDKLITSRFMHDHQSMNVLDTGAGNGWLSNHLALRGFNVYAVDLLVNSEDGLGAWRQYESKFTPVQAEFTRLPFLDGFMSMIVFNASFHYSENYEATLAEAMRVLYPDGWIVIMDSPVYHKAESGRNMVDERKASFISKYGFPSDSIKSESFLTYHRMNELTDKLGIRWEHIRPFYGFRWIMRPWMARLRGSREPAEFGLWVGQ